MKKFNTHQTKVTKCPDCGDKFDASTAIDGSDVKPRVGDLSVCVYCAAFLTYDENMDMQSILLSDIPDENKPAMIRGQEMIRMMLDGKLDD